MNMKVGRSYCFIPYSSKVISNKWDTVRQLLWTLFLHLLQPKNKCPTSSCAACSNTKRL